MAGVNRIQDPFGGMFGPDKIKDLKEKTIKPYKDEIARIDDKIKLGKNKESSWHEMGDKIIAIQNAIKTLRHNPIQARDAFSQKMAEISTTDAGDGDEYLTVTTTSEAPLGSIDVSVAQLAKAASIVVGHTYHDDVRGFANDEDIRLIFHSITIDGHNIQIAGGETIFDIQRKINSHGQLNNLNATVIKGDNNRHYLSIQSKTTGHHNITVTATTPYNHPLEQNSLEKYCSPGVDASITINGVLRTSASNTITDAIAGVTLDLKKVNNQYHHDHHHQTIEIKNDPEIVMEGVVELINAYNDYLQFSARMQQRNNKGYAETAYLGGSSGLRQADDIFSHITFTNNSITGQNALKSLAALGIEIADVPTTKHCPAHKQLTIRDSTLIRDAIYNRRSEVERLFKDTITPEAANHVSSLSITQNNRAILTGPLKIRAANHAGNYTIQYSTDNGAAWQPAHYNAADHKVTFAGTPFEGLELSFSHNLANGNHEEFIFSQGLADRLALVTEPLNESVKREIQNVNKEEDQYEAKKERAEKILGEQQKRLELEFSKIEIIALETTFMMEFFDSLNS